MSYEPVRKPWARPPRTREEIERDREYRRSCKEMKRARLYENAPPLFDNVGIVCETTPRDRPHDEDTKQTVHHVRAMKWKLKRDIKRGARVTSDKPADVYDTIEEQAGYHDWSRSWWKEAVPDYPKVQRANPTMKTKDKGVREGFIKERVDTGGYQAPPDPQHANCRRSVEAWNKEAKQRKKRKEAKP